MTKEEPVIPNETTILKNDYLIRARGDKIDNSRNAETVYRCCAPIKPALSLSPPFILTPPRRIIFGLFYSTTSKFELHPVNGSSLSATLFASPAWQILYVPASGSSVSLTLHSTVE